MEHNVSDMLQEFAGRLVKMGMGEYSGQVYEAVANAAVAFASGLSDIESAEFCDLRSDFDYYVEQCVEEDGQ